MSDVAQMNRFRVSWIRIGFGMPDEIDLDERVLRSGWQSRTEHLENEDHQ